MNLDIKEIKAKNGVENNVKTLNKLYLKDKLQMAHKLQMMLLKISVGLKRWVLKNILMNLNIY